MESIESLKGKKGSFKALVKLGATKKEAQSLLDWVGDNVVYLIPKT